MLTKTVHNSPQLREWLRREGHTIPLCGWSEFKFNAEVFAKALAQVASHHPRMGTEHLEMRAAYMLLNEGHGGTEPLLAVRERVIKHASRRVVWEILFAVIVIAFLLLFAVRGHAQQSGNRTSGITLELKNQGITQVVKGGGLVRFNCFTNLSCSYDAPSLTWTLTGSGGGGGSGCIPPGTSGAFLYDDAAGGCLNTAGLAWNNANHQITLTSPTTGGNNAGFQISLGVNNSTGFHVAHNSHTGTGGFTETCGAYDASSSPFAAFDSNIFTIFSVDCDGAIYSIPRAKMTAGPQFTMWRSDATQSVNMMEFWSESAGAMLSHISPAGLYYFGANPAAITGVDVNTSNQVTATHIAGSTNTDLATFDGTGNLVNYGGVTCTNQVLILLSAAGGGGCHTVVKADTSGTFPPDVHNLLSASHGDTVAGSPVRGDILIANNTPAWTKLALGAATAGKYAKSNGTDVVLSSGSASGTGTPTACSNQFVTSITLNADAAPTSTCTSIANAALPGSGAVTVNPGGVSCTLGSSCTIPLSAVNPQTATYQVLAADFSSYKTITVASGTFTITLVASGAQPPAGQYIQIINYGSGVVTVARSGQNINGAAGNFTLSAGSATAPTSALIESDGTNYFASIDEGTLGTITSVITNSPITGGTVNSGPVTLGCATCSVKLCGGTQALGTSAISSGAKSVLITIACTGITTSQMDFASDPSGVTGYAPSASGTLTVVKYITTNNLNIYVYNDTASSVTPGAMSVNYAGF